MGVLSTLTANLRTKLADAGYTNLPKNVSIDDVPDVDKVFFSVGVLPSGELGDEHGGGTLIQYKRAIVVKVAWQKDTDEEAFEDTCADDLEAMDAVVLKASNWTAGVMLIEKGSESEVENDSNLRRWDLIYPVRFRVAQNLS